MKRLEEKIANEAEIDYSRGEMSRKINDLRIGLRVQSEKGKKEKKSKNKRKRGGVLMRQSKGGTDDLPQGSDVKKRNRFSIV